MTFHRSAFSPWVAPFLMLLAIGFALPAKANEFILAGSGAMTIPSGDMKQFADETSFYGGAVDLRSLRWGNASWGAQIGLHVLNVRSNNPTDIGDLTIGGGDQYRWVTAVPFHLTGHWYPVKNHQLTVFVGAGLGATRAIRRVDVAWNRTQEDSWHASGTPEFGILFPFTSEWKLMARVQYHYSLDQGDHWGPRFLALGLGIAEY